MMYWRQTFLIVLAAAMLSACGTGGFAYRAKPPALPAIPPQEVFVTAVRDICFSSLERNISHAALAEMRGFQAFSGAGEQYRKSPDEVFYNAVFTSAPVLVAINEKASECSVIAVRGNYSELKYLAEVEIADFSDKYGANAPDHIAFVGNDIKQTYALKFTLLSDSAVDAEE
ncbi:hypothetical protein [Parvularcula sp. IMCC14364]|uniref:hypothetical protein n=1 Tax=Parvularcula sp. IMCC14364 TaxID=3067902 RepID=UPI0027411487|nr:hypothetical protein [Parvularcula sp. IMCC14364]